MNAEQVVTTLKNTAKPVTEVQFPAVTICGSGFHMNNVAKKINMNFQKWRTDTGRNGNDIRGDMLEYMNTTFQIKPQEGDQEPAKLIMDILDSMVVSNVEDWVTSNAVKENVFACMYSGTNARVKRQTDPLKRTCIDTSWNSSSTEYSVHLPAIDIFLNPEKKDQRDRIAHKKEKVLKDYFTSSDMRSLYPKLFDVLWDSTLPCFQEEGEDKDAMVLSCQLGGKQINCSNLFSRVPTDTGMCCTLNNVHALKESEYKQLVNKLQGGSRRMSVKSQVGRQNGLRLTLDLHSNSVSFGTLEKEYDAFNVFIGQPAEFPMMKQKSIQLQPGHEHFIDLSATVVSNNGIEDILPEARDCYFSDEGDLEFYEKYTFSNCRLECAIKKAEDIYNCVPWHLPRV